MGWPHNLRDEDLLIDCAIARKAAHDAPRRIQTNADGSATVGNSVAWADRSREYVTLAEEVRRRGLTQLLLSDAVGDPSHASTSKTVA